MLVIRRTIVQMTQHEYDNYIANEIGVCTCCGRTHSNTPLFTENQYCCYCKDKSVYGLNVLLKAGRVEIV